MARITTDPGIIEPTKTQSHPASMVSWLPYITVFCCCLGLEAGAKVIGYLQLLVSITLVVICVYFTVLFANCMGDEDTDQVCASWHKITLGITAVTTVHVMLGAMLLYGVYKRNTTCLRAWLYVYMVLFATGLLYIIIITAKFGFSSSGSEIFLTFAEGLLFFSVLAYFIVCINSYYMMVKSCEDMQC